MLWGLTIGANIVAILGGEQLPFHVRAFVKTTMCLLMSVVCSRCDMPYVSVAFFFSYLGDCFLVASFKKFFVHGMGSFLVGRVFFCIGFRKLNSKRLKSLKAEQGKNFRVLRRSRRHQFCVAASVALLVWLVGYLWPRIADMPLKLTLTLYGISMVVSNVFAAAYSRSALVPFGGLFYMLCDSILAAQTFAAWEGWWVDPLIWTCYSVGLQSIAAGCVVDYEGRSVVDLMLQGDPDEEEIRAEIKVLKEKIAERKKKLM